MSEYMDNGCGIGNCFEPRMEIKKDNGRYSVRIGYTSEMINEMTRKIAEALDDEIMERLGLEKVVHCRECESNDAECKPFDVHCNVFKASIGDPDFYCGYGVRA